MRYILWVLCAAAFVATPANAAMSLDEFNAQIDATNVLVNDGCSGTLIDADKQLILTANHCVENQYETIEREKISDEGVVTKEKVRRLKDGMISRLTFSGSESVQTTTYKVRLLAVSRDRDLALLKVIAPIQNAKAARLSCENPKRGEQVYIVGNPLGILYASVTVGIISSLQRDYKLLRTVDASDEKSPLWQISAGVVGGNSGGAVYNRDGELIGVPVLGHRTNEVLGFAVPLDAIKAFLKEQKLEELYTRCESKKAGL